MAFSTPPLASQDLLTTIMNMIAQRTGYNFTLQPTSQYGGTQFYACDLGKEQFGIFQFAVAEAVADLQVDSVDMDKTRGCPFQFFQFRITATVIDRIRRASMLDVGISYVYRPDLNKVWELADYQQQFPEVH